MSTPSAAPLVGLIMGSHSDWETLSQCAETLTTLGIPFESRVVSAHRTPHLMVAYASEAGSRGLKLLIAGAGGAAHLPGMVAALTHLPVIGVPIESRTLRGIDSLLSIVQMPAGVPVATVAIGKAGATNAALLAASILALYHPPIEQALTRYRQEQTEKVLNAPAPTLPTAHTSAPLPAGATKE